MKILALLVGILAFSGAALADENNSLMNSNPNNVSSSTNANSINTIQQPGSVLPEVNVKDLNKNPDKFQGQNVQVTGNITRLEGANAFILEGSNLLNNRILVVVAKNQQAGVIGQQPGVVDQQAGSVPNNVVIKEKQKVQLTGKLEELAFSKIEEKYQPGLKDEIKSEFEGNMPVLVVPPNGIKTLS